MKKVKNVKIKMRKADFQYLAGFAYDYALILSLARKSLAGFIIFKKAIKI